MKTITIQEYLLTYQDALVIDVRSPSEYSHARIPGAKSIPLFTDEERKVVGTTYKQVSRQDAIKIGLDYFGPKMRGFVEEIENTLKGDNQKPILVHCWRGGMRSDAVSWLLDLYGFNILKLDGGYKAFRGWVLNTFEQSYDFEIVAGRTGSGKTRFLHSKRQEGGAVIDLEGIASHKGSAFGHINMPIQPSQEYFENQLAVELYNLRRSKIWIEDESARIGQVSIPRKIYNQMQLANSFHLEIDMEERLKNIMSEYGDLPITELKASIGRIRKRLGGLECQNALAFLDVGEVESCFKILMKYYDKWYDRSMAVRDSID